MSQEFLPYGLRKKEILDKSREDVRVRRFLTPQRIVWTSQGDQCSVTGTEYLLEDREPQINLYAKDLCVLENKGQPASIVLDFGVEFHGNLKLFVKDVSRERVNLRVRFGESVMETMEDTIGGKHNARNDHINRDSVINVGFLSANELGPTGYRFVRIDLLDENTAISFKAIKGIAIYRELEYKGSFRCNDERLNTIWNTGAYTIHLNMQEYVWDGIKRDRLVWIGDMHPETSTIQAVFGTDPSVPASLDLAREETPLPGWMDGMSSYSIWWVLIHYGWYMQNGDKAYLEEQRTYLAGLLNQLCDLVDTETGMEKMPAMRFIDWPSDGDEEAVHAGLQGLLKQGLVRGSFLCRELGEDEVAERCDKMADILQTHCPDPHGNKQAAAFLALSGIADPKAMNEVIKVDGAHRLSTFLGYYVLKAQAMAGDIDGALSNINSYWGAMLDRGATTFWEDFNLDWLEGSGRIDEIVPEGVKDLHGDYGAHCYIGLRHSLCHGWASGPTAFLSQYVLGFTPVAPGCRKMALKPSLGHLDFAEGSYPTPYGVIRVRHEKTADGSLKTTIFEKPDQVEII